MIEVDALMALLTVEAVVLLAAMVAALLIREAKTRRLARVRAHALVGRVAAQGLAEPAPLAASLQALSVDLGDAQVRPALQELAGRQRAFYRHVILAFLQHDLDKLGKLDAQVKDLFDAQGQSLKAIVESLTGAERAERQELQGLLSEAEAERAEAEARIAQTLARCSQLEESLQQALHALEEVSTEYTKMFGDPKTAERLIASQTRMLEAFERAGRLADLRSEAPGQANQELRR